MDYNLLKQLKEAGFPQKEFLIERELLKHVMHDVGFHLTASDLATDEEGRLLDKARYTSVFSPDWINTKEGLDSTVYNPTSDEIIEELGVQFIHLFRHRDKEFQAFGEDIQTGVPKELRSEICDSPKEALIKLYISLHGKNN